tara:strand:- start:332 stop:496 length:165 start_codon:yes stop_codon:yes gene_type:complete
MAQVSISDRQVPCQDQKLDDNGIFCAFCAYDTGKKTQALPFIDAPVNDSGVKKS